MSATLALVAAPTAADDAGTEFLRVVAALRAVGRRVVLLETGAGVGVLSAEARVSEEGGRYLRALREDGVEARPAEDLAASIADAADVLVLPDPGRRGDPPVLRLRAGSRPDAAALEALPRAGQVWFE